MLRPIKIAACVVFYYPHTNVIANINSYYKNIDLLIIIDNSLEENQFIKSEVQKMVPEVIYYCLKENTGIAAALNKACNIAIKQNCEWILTMDQDSNFKELHAKQLMESIPKVEDIFGRVAIISPLHVLHEDIEIKTKKQYEVRNIVMTSGNLLNLNAYVEAGPFEEKLFMDFVDYEYCLRLKSFDYKIIQDNSTFLKHSLGNFEIKKILNNNIGVSNHNWVRRYYMTRNSLFVGFKYFRNNFMFFLNVLKNIIVWDPFIIISFEKDKLRKLKAIYKGIFDFLTNRYGSIK